MKGNRLPSLTAVVLGLLVSAFAYAQPIYCNAGRIPCNQVYADCMSQPGAIEPNCRQLRDECYLDYCR